MGHVYRPTYTVRNPRTGERETRASRKWYVEYKDAAGKRQRKPGYTDLVATQRLLADLESEVARVQAGILPPTIDQARRPLADHLADYLDHLRSANDTGAHVQLVQGRCERIMAACRFDRWADVAAHPFELYLAQQRATPQKKTGRRLSIRTSNGYLQQFRGFVGWLARRLGAVDPLRELRPLNADVDRRWIRRALPEVEFARLVQVAAASPITFYHQPGPDRAMLYVVAAYTGLRASELASLTPEQLHLGYDPARLQVEAGYSKRRRLDTVPLQKALAVRLAAWLPTRRPGQSLWPGQWAAKHNAAKILRFDLEAAGIPYKDQRGRVFDFHALRSQFITGLARAGVSLVEAQKLARHSTPTLTSQYYVHLELEDLGRSVERLPRPPELR